MPRGTCHICGAPVDSRGSRTVVAGREVFLCEVHTQRARAGLRELAAGAGRAGRVMLQKKAPKLFPWLEAGYQVLQKARAQPPVSEPPEVEVEVIDG